MRLPAVARRQGSPGGRRSGDRCETGQAACGKAMRNTRPAETSEWRSTWSLCARCILAISQRSWP